MSGSWEREKSLKDLKILIIGSGPAGLTAAIYASRANLLPLLIEGYESGGQLMTTTDIENFPGFEKGISGPLLIQNMRAQAARFGTQFLTKDVVQVDFSQAPFCVWTGPEELYRSEVVIISTGARAKYLGIPSEKKYMNRGVSACATCDGAFFKNLEVAVVGGGDTAMEEALHLTHFASKVYVIHRRDGFRASKIMSDRVLNHSKVEVIWNTEVQEVLGDEKKVQALALRDVKTQEVRKLSISGVFLAIGHKPNTDLFRGILSLNEMGYIMTQPGTTRTSIPGIFVAGDVQDPTYRQAITAAGTGCMAALEAQRWLEEKG